MQEPDSTLLSMTEAVVYKRELARGVAHQLKAHPATRSDIPRLDSADCVSRRRAKIHCIELLADNI